MDGERGLMKSRLYRVGYMQIQIRSYLISITYEKVQSQLFLAYHFLNEQPIRLTPGVVISSAAVKQCGLPVRVYMGECIS